MVVVVARVVVGSGLSLGELLGSGSLGLEFKSSILASPKMLVRG
jgi:hypothetical protein